MVDTVDSSFSSIKEITKNVRITLSVAYQTNEIIAISDVLDSWKRQYIHQLQGIVVSYKNVSMVSKFAYIKQDYPAVHCEVKATFKLFIPTVGSIVKGRVNRISHDYIGCLVHDTINVTVNRTHNDDVSYYIELDQGEITQECVNLMEELHLLNDEIDTNLHNILTSTSYGLNEEKNYDTDKSNSPKKKKSSKLQIEQNRNRPFESLDIENGDVSLSSLSCNESNLFLENSSDASSESPKKRKKRSNKILQIEQSTERLVESSSSKLNEMDVIDSNLLKKEITTDCNYLSPKKKKSKKSNNNSPEKSVTLNSTDFQNMLSGEENSTDTSSYFSSSSKKKKKRKCTADTLNSPTLFSDTLSSSEDEFKQFKIPRTPQKEKHKTLLDKFSAAEETNDRKDFASLLHYKDSTPDSLSTSVSAYKSNKNFDNLIEMFSSFDPSLENQFLCNEVTLNGVKDKSLHSTKKAKKKKHKSCDKYGLPKKKKSKWANNNSPEKSVTLNSSDFQNMRRREENSTDTSSYFSSCSKKKKNRKCTADTLSSPTHFSDSLSSSKDEIKPFKILRTPRKKKCKTLRDNFSVAEKTSDPKDFASLLHYKDSTPDSLSTSVSAHKSNKNSSENFDNLIEVVSSFDPSLENQLCNKVVLNDVKHKPLHSTKKAKKRKHESSDEDGLPKKKKKVKKIESISVKANSKHKGKKNSKSKSKDDSKSDKKKKSKKKVISSKRKLPKIRKKKSEEVKNKKLKSSKHKDKNVP